MAKKQEKSQVQCLTCEHPAWTKGTDKAKCLRLGIEVSLITPRDCKDHTLAPMHVVHARKPDVLFDDKGIAK